MRSTNPMCELNIRTLFLLPPTLTGLGAPTIVAAVSHTPCRIDVCRSPYSRGRPAIAMYFFRSIDMFNIAMLMYGIVKKISMLILCGLFFDPFDLLYALRCTADIF
jgi:hypothetical protein